MIIGKGSCNGTFGELVQGVLGERPFLVTLPINDLKSEATFVPNPDTLEIVGPTGKIKAVTACKRLLEFLDINCGGTLLIQSNILEGKGMASSSADIVAALRAVADSFDLKLTEEMISKIATGIEPTDGVMYRGVVSYDYISGELIEKLGEMPDFSLIGMDLGDIVDTIKFNQIPKQYSNEDRAEFLEAYEILKRGMLNQDLSLINKACTISARINQKFLPKPYFSEYEELAKEYECGIVTGHSGTVLGLMSKLDNQYLDELMLKISKSIPHPWFIFKNKMKVKT
ncbi:kinase [Bacillus marasmi]|uniref:GHMP family kinase ATP-binding protein n=1 Tax=Bacillus marasmi TaxID=1926279 RepID=UPI0011C6FA31|nr:kinase [Bacillus marasmi]